MRLGAERWRLRGDGRHTDPEMRKKCGKPKQWLNPLPLPFFEQKIAREELPLEKERETVDDAVLIDFEAERSPFDEAQSRNWDEWDLTTNSGVWGLTDL
jgi:hypothetical protein